MPEFIRHRQPSARTQVVGLLQRQLETDSYPRMQMGLIVVLTGGVGLVRPWLPMHLAPSRWVR